MLKFVNSKNEIVWVENFTRIDTFVIVHYRGKKYKCSKGIFGTKLFPMDKTMKIFLKNAANIDVEIPSFIRSSNNHSIPAHSETSRYHKKESFFISPNGTCLKKMDWDFD